MCFVVVELHVTVSYIKILRTAQKCFYGKFMSPVKIVSFPSCNEPDAALRQKNVRLLVAFFGPAVVKTDKSLRGFSVFVTIALKRNFKR